MRTKVYLVLFSVLAIGLAGCNESYVGVIEKNNNLSSGANNPDILFTRFDGTQVSLNKVKQPVVILAFTATENCCSLNSGLVKLAQRFKYQPATIVQIHCPTAQCSCGLDYCKSCNTINEDMLILYDPKKIAWKAYNHPKPNTVILIDEDDKIIDTRSIDNLDILANKAEKICNQISWDRLEGF